MLLFAAQNPIKIPNIVTFIAVPFIFVHEITNCLSGIALDECSAVFT